MKRERIIATLLVIIAVVAGTVSSVIDSSKNDCTTFEANVEALSQPENTGGSSKIWDCWSQFQESPGVSSTRCGDPCVEVEGKIGFGNPSKCYAN